jgi:hypothetical protein
MHHAGVISEDSPDPMAEQWERIDEMPFRVFGLAPQSGLEEIGPSGFGSGYDADGTRDGHVGLTYAVFRNPAERSDPANLADVDDAAREALEQRPSWPLPAWYLRQLDLQRYPMLWEAIRTSWHRDAGEQSIDEALVDHTNYVLMNQFRVQRGLDGSFGSLPPAPDVTAASVQRGATLRVDGVDRPAVRIDTDPHVFAIGVPVDDTLVTVVINRDELQHLALEVVTRGRETPGAD